MHLTKTILLTSVALSATVTLFGQNPIISTNFTADPSARVLNGRVFVFPSHDIPAPADYGRKDWFCMADYHAYSSENLVDWTDHGVIVDQKTTPWVNGTSYSMWAPDCHEKNGKYYFYFPANQKGAGNAVGVAIADKPEGPYIPQEKPIPGVNGIDPCIFIDDDGTPYLTWAGRGLTIAKLKNNMVELDGQPVTVRQNTPNRGLKEGPYLFKRNGKYYYTFPWVDKNHECLCYCMGDNPMGPFEYKGKIMEENPNCWTNHHSVIEYKGQWYLFYHHNDYSPNFDKNRSFCIDYLNFNEDGTIVQVVPTKRGVGNTPATNKIQIDRYSAIDKSNLAWIEYNRTENPFEGWRVVFCNNNSYRQPIWVEYDRVDFGNTDLKSAKIYCFSRVGGTIELRADAKDGQLLSTIKIEGKNEWQEVSAPVTTQVKGLHNLFVNMTSGLLTYVDWVQFQK